MEITTETKVLAGVLVATVVIIIGGAFWAGRSTNKPIEKIASDPTRLVREDSASTGPKDAKVTVVEFSDFQCPACGAVAPVIEQLINGNTGKSVRFVYRHFPLPAHADAPLAAQASIAAQRQNKFWEYSRELFANQDKLKRDDLIGYAKSLNLNIDDFTKDMDSDRTKDAINRDRQDGEALNIQATPTFFINNVQYQGQFTAADMQSAIDAALAKAR